MASYRDRVREDLDRWIAAGLVGADKREPILQTLPETRRIDAATALAWIGGVLLGVSAIAFVSANWASLSRLVRFALVLALFASAAGAGSWAASRKRPLLSDIALTLAALLFAAAIGLTGQIFDIVGDPRTAMHIAGVAAFALALAGRSIGAAAIALVLIGLGDFTGFGFLVRDEVAPWMILAAPLGAWLALYWRSAPLAHLSAMGVIYCFGWFVTQYDANHPAALLFLFTVICAALAAAARWLYLQGRAFASVFYGWFAWAAFAFFIPAGYASMNQPGFGDGNVGIVHRVLWLALAGGLVALGRFDRHLLVTAIGILGMAGAIFAIMSDLGLDLLSAAGIFLLCAIAALVGGLMLRRKAKTA